MLGPLAALPPEPPSCRTCEAYRLSLDDSAPLAERWDSALPRMHAVGRSIASAMLLVAYPAQCSVWIGVSGEKMVWLGLIPEPWTRRSNGSS